MRIEIPHTGHIAEGAAYVRIIDAKGQEWVVSLQGQGGLWIIKHAADNLQVEPQDFHRISIK